MAMEAVAATTEPPAAPAGGVRLPTTGRRRPPGSGPDRVSVVLVSLAAFLVVLALLAGQLRASPPRVSKQPVIVLRRVYQTTVVETVPGPGSGTSVSQSVSSSGSSSSATPTTRASG